MKGWVPPSFVSKKENKAAQGPLTSVLSAAREGGSHIIAQDTQRQDARHIFERDPGGTDNNQKHHPTVT